MALTIMGLMTCKVAGSAADVPFIGGFQGALLLVAVRTKHGLIWTILFMLVSGIKDTEQQFHHQRERIGINDSGNGA